MNKRLNNLDIILSILANIISIIISLLGVSYSISKETFVFLIFFIFIILLNVFNVKYFIYKMHYIKFIEYLFNNDMHRFTLLPKFRTYIEYRHRLNKVHINNLKIEYTISKNGCFDNNIADLTINYELKIKNYHLPNQYYIMFGNDYAEQKPEIKYSLNDSSMMDATFIEVRHSPYEKGMINEAIINLDYDNLPKKEIKLNIRIQYSNSFDFDTTKTDTLILLPLLFGKKINKIDYKIKFNKFESDMFYCNAYLIGRSSGLNYEIKDISVDLIKKTNLLEIKLNNIQLESAYYFRIGTDKNEMDP